MGLQIPVIKFSKFSIKKVIHGMKRSSVKVALWTDTHNILGKNCFVKHRCQIGNLNL